MTHSTTSPDWGKKSRRKEGSQNPRPAKNEGGWGLFLRRVFVALFWLALWLVADKTVGQEILIVSPAQVLQRIAQLVVQPFFWQAAGASLLRVLIAFVLAVAVGTIMAILTSASVLLRDLFQPLLVIVRATPVASFIILALVWLKTGTVPVFIGFLMVLPVVWGNVSQGIARIDPKLLQMAKAFRFGWIKTLKRVCIPSVMPYFMAACTTGLGLAWKASVAAEVLGVPRMAIGSQLYNAKIYLETADLFAWTAVVIVLSLLIEKALVALASRIGGRYNVR